jgi:hypothetical protein
MVDHSWIDNPKTITKGMAPSPTTRILTLLSLEVMPCKHFPEIRVAGIKVGGKPFVPAGERILIRAVRLRA